ncbi:HIV Tat-specific factor 1 [Larimichthys crocea]|uniref:Uncharacterized protein n=1 Tax=Larimichthys crocea TaxID=215358 RepID=A0ACD3R5E4_LARCR|nr:HIV Tat-specific factor 1 [Larimichthys crocea]
MRIRNDTGSTSLERRRRMSGGPDANKEFMEQLRMQELYGQRNADGSDPNTYTDPDDGTVYDWDHEKKAWFPKITEDFIAAYQANYGFTQEGDPDTNNAAVSSTDPVAPEPGSKPSEKEKPGEATQKPDQHESPAKEAKQKGEKRKAEPGWFDIDDNKNTNVYVSGLPPDISTEEFTELMSKCGIVMRDPITEEYKVKLYKDREGNLKGDGLCCYLKEDPLVLNEYRDDLRTECEKFGDVKKVILFDRHPDGVASVAFKEPEQADACIQSFNDRWFGGRQLSAQLWDGSTDYQVEETTREREERLKTWSTFLEGGKQGQQNNNNNNAEPAEGATTTTEPTEAPSTTETEQHPVTEPQQQEQEADSTDSSLAGSDEEA